MTHDTRLARRLAAALAAALLAASSAPAQHRRPAPAHEIREVNDVARPEAGSVVAIVGATLVDGRGGPPVRDSAVVVSGERIVAAGARSAVRVPQLEAMKERRLSGTASRRLSD